MSISFVRFGCIFLLHTASVIEFFVCNGVGGCLCPISSKIILMYTASCAMMYSAASSASVADVMMCLIMCVMLRIAPLFWGIFASLIIIIIIKNHYHKMLGTCFKFPIGISNIFISCIGETVGRYSQV